MAGALGNLPLPPNFAYTLFDFYATCHSLWSRCCRQHLELLFDRLEATLHVEPPDLQRQRGAAAGCSATSAAAFKNACSRPSPIAANRMYPLWRCPACWH